MFALRGLARGRNDGVESTRALMDRRIKHAFNAHEKENIPLLYRKYTYIQDERSWALKRQT